MSNPESIPGVREAFAVLGATVLEINRANGWDVTTAGDFEACDRKPENVLPAKIAYLHAELSDAVEAYRVGDENRVAMRLEILLGETLGALKAQCRSPFSTDFGSEYVTCVKIPAKLALVHSEVSEALMAYHVRDPGNFIEEAADVVIRVVDMTAGLGMDLGAAIEAKLAKNRTRGHRHGGKVV